MIHNNLLRLTEILHTSESIKDHVDEVYQLRLALDEHLTDEEKLNFNFKIKSCIQQEARKAFHSNSSFGAILAATGVGKSKIAVDEIYDIFKLAKSREEWEWPNILIVVPTEKLRDSNWPDELDKWGFENINDHIQLTCYASLKNYRDQKFDLVVFDEGHNVTENNFEPFMKENIVNSCMWLSATKPNSVKILMLEKYGIKPVYKITLDEATKLGIVAPYDITIVTTTLDNITKNIQGGSKKKPFLTTEKGKYTYLSASAFSRPNKFGFINRMRFIYDLRSKTEAAKYILENIIPKDLKTLIFCGGIEQAIELCDRRYFSKPTLNKKDKDNPVKVERYNRIISQYEGDKAFNDLSNDIISRMSCVDAINEGHNIVGMDVGFIVQLNGNELDLIQRIGRFIRYRPGHRGKIIILCVEGTVDKDWVNKAIKNLNKSNITFVELSRLKMGIETISFD